VASPFNGANLPVALHPSKVMRPNNGVVYLNQVARIRLDNSIDIHFDLAYSPDVPAGWFFFLQYKVPLLWVLAFNLT
jgi:hypothetical protein